MIRTVADLLLTIRDAALPELDNAPVTHAPTIGDMYEGLSGDLLKHALPEGVDLQVVTGLITDGSGSQSGQIDRMLVVGEGVQIPRTDKYIWHVKDVIAVLEVKKNLDATRLAEAVDQLLTVKKIQDKWIQSEGSSLIATGFRQDIFEKTFSQITGRITPSHDQMKSADVSTQLMYTALQVDQISPLRIVIGYHGWKTEAGFRRAMAKFLGRRVNQRGLGPVGLPHLIACGNYALVKANGHPYFYPMQGGGWDVYLSIAGNPLLVLLELIWTRLDERYGFKDPWGDDLENEVAKKFLSAHPVEHGGRMGWEYHFQDLPVKILSQSPRTRDWQPAVLTQRQFDIVEGLLKGDDVLLADPAWSSNEGKEQTFNEAVMGLKASGLVASDAKRLVLTCDSIVVVVMPDGSLIAAENLTGRLTRWLTGQVLAT